MFYKNKERFGLTRNRVFMFLGLSLGGAFFEGFGMAMFLPVLEFIEKGGEAAAVAGKSKVWDAIFKAHEFAGISVSLMSLIGVVCVLMMTRIGFIYARQVYMAWLSQTVLHETRAGLFGALVHAKFSHFDGQATGRLVNLMTNEALRVGGHIAGTFAYIANLLVIIGYFCVLLWLSWAMTLMAALLLGIGGLVVVYAVRSTRKYSLKTTVSNREFSFLAVERLGFIRLIKLSAKDDREAGRVREASNKVRNNVFTLARLNARVDLMMEPVVVLAGLGILLFSFKFFAMSLAQIGLFMVVLLRLLPLAKEFMKSRQTVTANSGGIEAVNEAWDSALADSEEHGNGGEPFERLDKGIEVKGLTFTYPGQTEPALKNVDLTIPAGVMTALVGPSGAGKSTLIDLLPLLREPQEGSILYDGVPAADYDWGSLRSGIAFVPQDAAILNDTVRNNIAFACGDVTEEQIESALRRARAWDFVQELPEGLDSELGERGTRLSGGQRQRLSLARALLQDAPILVLDEPTSALDSESERQVQAAIDDLRREGVTIIVIAHRLSTIKGADQIIVISGGGVKEQGTHKELMVSREWYSRICDMQSIQSSGEDEGQGA